MDSKSPILLAQNSCVKNGTEYCSLEPDSLSSLGIKSPSFDSKAPMSLYDVTSAVFTLLFMAAILAATYRFVVASLYRLEASESGIRKSNEIFKQTILGLLGIFILFPMLIVLNRGLLLGDFSLGGIGGKGGGFTREIGAIVLK